MGYHTQIDTCPFGTFHPPFNFLKYNKKLLKILRIGILLAIEANGWLTMLISECPAKSSFSRISWDEIALGC